MHFTIETERSPLGPARCHSREPPQISLIAFAAQGWARLYCVVIGSFQRFSLFPLSHWLRELSVLVACQQPSGRGGESSAFRFWAGLTHNEEQRLGETLRNAAVNKYNNHWGRRNMENQVRWLLCLLEESELFTEKTPAGCGLAGLEWILCSASQKKKTAPAANVVVWLWSYASRALIHRYLPLASFSLQNHSAPLHSSSQNRAHRDIYTLCLFHSNAFKTWTHIVKYHQDIFEMRFLFLLRWASVPIRSSVGRWLKAKEPLQGAGEKICPLQVWFGRRGGVRTASGLKPHTKGHIPCVILFISGCLMFSCQVITFFCVCVWNKINVAWIKSSVCKCWTWIQPQWPPM